MREAIEVAVGLLARREHSVRQLNQKLAKRGFDEPAITSAIASCQRLNLQSDTRFAEATCRSRIGRGYGPLMIKQLLQHEGVASDIIERVFEEFNRDIDWVAEVSSVWVKKYRVYDPEDKARQKQWQFLRYRGFDDATIRAMFQTLEAESHNY